MVSGCLGAQGSEARKGPAAGRGGHHSVAAFCPFWAQAEATTTPAAATALAGVAVGGAHPPTPPPATPTECGFCLQVFRYGWRQQRPSRGNWLRRRGLFISNLQAISPNAPFRSVLLHVGSALESQANVQAHYNPALVAAAAT